MGILLLSLLPLGPGFAQQTQGQGLDWRYEPDSEGCNDTDPDGTQEHAQSVDQDTDRTAFPSEVIAQPEAMAQDPAPVVLPQDSWPEEEDHRKDWGWQWKEPSFGTSDPLTSSNEDRDAVEIAAQRQTEALARSAPPPPGAEALPDQLQGLNYHVDFGVEFRF